MNNNNLRQPVLVGDIGGTNARFGLFDARSLTLEVSSVSTLPVAGYHGLAEAIHCYLDRMGLASDRIPASLAIAGPAEGQQLTLVNGGWTFDRDELLDQAGLSSALYMNDFRAQSLAMGFLADQGFVAESLVEVKSGTRLADRNHLVMGPGTGLGVAGLIKHSGEWLALPGEGGHVSFGPTDEVDEAILRWFRKRFPRVSIERILSGSGLEMLYQAMGEYEGQEAEALSAAAISCEALTDPDSLAHRTWQRFIYIIGSVAGDQVLTLGARGGVFLCGGILPRMKSQLQEGEFERGFLNKGRYREYLEAVPVHLCVASEPGLLGAGLAWQQEQQAQTLIS